MQNDSGLYRRILKATGLFGGVQSITVLCSLVRNKVIAVLLGPEGVGIISLFNSATDVVSSVTGLGLRQSGVRDVSAARAAGGSGMMRIISVLRRLSLFTGLLGAMIFIGAAPLLSRITFGSDRYIWGFVFLSASLLLNALTGGEQAVLQGGEKLKLLARSSVAGSILSLAISVPLYYFFGMAGIVPSLIAASLSTYIFAAIYSRRTYPPSEKITARIAFREGTPMMRLGIYMTISGFITTLLNYVLIAWLNRYSSTADVGLYQSGYTLVSRYVGLIFIAMSSEYYPRLSAVSSDNAETSRQVSRQIETTLLLLAPLATLFLMFQNEIINLLYDKTFNMATRYTGWAITGVLFKGISWSLGFVLLAKSQGRLFLITEFISDTTSFIINILFYTIWGLEGLGAAFLLNFVLYTILIWGLCAVRYEFRPEKRMYSVLTTTTILVAAVFILLRIPALYGIPLASAVTLATLIYSVTIIKKRVEK